MQAILASLPLVFSPVLSQELPQSTETYELTHEERDRMFREAQFCVMRYHYWMNEADENVDSLLTDVQHRAWATAMKIAVESALIKDPRGKAIAALVTVVNEAIDFVRTYAYDKDIYEVLRYIDESLAIAEAWIAKYDELQDRLLRDE